MTLMAVALFAVGYMQVNLRNDIDRVDRAIAESSQKQQGRMDAMEQRASNLEQDSSDLRSQGSTASKAIQDTQKRLAQTRSSTDKKIADANDKAAKQVSELSDRQEARLGTMQGSLDEARSKLDTAVGDLGQQSGLIAHNRDELADLKRRGERDYIEFDLKKAKEYKRVADLSLKLNKADRGRQRYTLEVLVADKRLEKRDKTALEPLQLYMPGNRRMVEIVVWDVKQGSHYRIRQHSEELKQSPKEVV